MMNDKDTYKTLIVFAGPNGSGKSTITSDILEIIKKKHMEYVNPDNIKRRTNCTDFEAVQIAQKTKEKLISEGKSFAFETVLSSQYNIDIMKKAKQSGYYVQCIYVLTNNPDINVKRVSDRVKHKGHDVPEEKIRSRYNKALTLFPKLFEICDEINVYDNSKDDLSPTPSLILSYDGQQVTMFPNEYWTKDDLTALQSGRFIEEKVLYKNEEISIHEGIVFIPSENTDKTPTSQQKDRGKASDIIENDIEITD